MFTVCSFPWIRLIQFRFNLAGLAKSLGFSLPVGELHHLNRRHTYDGGEEIRKGVAKLSSQFIEQYFSGITLKFAVYIAIITTTF